jgi:hypothetical protein
MRYKLYLEYFSDIANINKISYKEKQFLAICSPIIADVQQMSKVNGPYQMQRTHLENVDTRSWAIRFHFCFPRNPSNQLCVNPLKHSDYRT